MVFSSSKSTRTPTLARPRYRSTFNMYRHTRPMRKPFTRKTSFVVFYDSIMAQVSLAGRALDAMWALLDAGASSTPRACSSRLLDRAPDLTLPSIAAGLEARFWTEDPRARAAGAPYRRRRGDRRRPGHDASSADGGGAQALRSSTGILTRCRTRSTVVPCTRSAR